MLNHFPREVTQDNYKDMIEQYFIEIGVTEKLDISLARIADKLGFEYSNNVPFLNKTKRVTSVSDSVKDQFIELNPLEYEVYNFALSKYR